jgi:hypothetical protein
LKASEFCSRCEALFGYGWRTRFANGTGSNYATVKRWASGASPVPGTVVALIEALETLKRSRRKLPERFIAAPSATTA